MIMPRVVFPALSCPKKKIDQYPQGDRTDRPEDDRERAREEEDQQAEESELGGWVHESVPNPKIETVKFEGAPPACVA